ncbi:MAG: Cna B-type domain-containing protein [Clostridiales bacterium]|nr:Cna B-type domain-containing protein [Clostridiales bacterium]
MTYKSIRIRRGIGKFLALALVLVCFVGTMSIQHAYAAGDGLATLTVEQSFTDDGMSVPPSKVFTYQLTPKTAFAPMPVGSGSSGYTFTVTGNNSVDIGPINFQAAGTGIYTYELRCITTADTGYTIDPEVYTIEIVVTNELMALSTIYLRNGNKTSQIYFEHTYEGTEKVTISGSKTWDHGWLPSQYHPTSITILVLDDEGNVVVRSQVTAAEHWSWLFKLDKYDAQGNEIAYTIDEIKQPGYTKQVNGYNVKNTYNPNDSDKPGSWPPRNPTKGPNTGDDSNLNLYITLMIFSSFGLILLFFFHFKKGSMFNDKTYS